MDVNVVGAFLCARAFGAHMVAQRKGTVINIASTAGLGGEADLTAYCASKHAVIGLTKALAIEWARHGVTVNAIAPGYFRTDINKHALDDVKVGPKIVGHIPAAPRRAAGGAGPAHRLSRVGRRRLHDRVGGGPRRRAARAVAVANVLCVVELLNGRALPVSLEVLGQARRVSTELGATLYAVVALPRAPSWSDDDLVATLAARGADKVVIATDETLDGGEELRWGTHGAALAAVCDLLSPSLLLFGATPTAREVAARAAARLGAAYLHEAWIEAAAGQLALFEGAGAEARVLEGELEFAVVATVPAGRYALAVGDEEAEVEVVATSGRAPDFDERDAEPDSRAQVVVIVDDETRRAGESLAKALGGELAPARGAMARLAISLGPPCPAAERRVRLGGGDDADYVVRGDPAALAEALARAVAAEAKPEGKRSSKASKREGKK